MKSIPEATAITLTNEERSELDGLARSTKTEHRLRQRARIVLLSADGLATRAIGRAVGCTTGTASKWRVRYAERRFGGLDETGERGNDPKWDCQESCVRGHSDADGGRIWQSRKRHWITFWTAAIRRRFSTRTASLTS